MEVEPVVVDQFSLSISSIVFYSGELVLLTVGQVLCTLVLIVLCRVRCFNQSLRFLLANFTFSYACSITSRYMVIIPLMCSHITGAVIGPEVWCRCAKWLHDVSIFVGELDLIVVVVERSVATMVLSNDDERRSSVFGGLLVAVQWVSAFAFVWYNQATNDTAKFNYGGAPCLREYMNSSVIFVLEMVFIFVDFVSVSVFYGLLRINRRRYGHGNTAIADNYLSMKYQAAENIRITQLLFPLTLARFAVSTLSASLMIIATVVGRATHNLDTVHLLGQCFDLVIASYVVIFPQLAFHGHSSLWRELQRIVICLRRNPVSDGPTANIRGAQPADIRGINGRQLVIGAEAEFEHHFFTLRAQWNA